MPLVIAWGANDNYNISKREALFSAMIAMILTACTLSMAIVYLMEVNKQDKSDDRKLIFYAFVVMAAINAFMALWALLMFIGVLAMYDICLIPWIMFAVPGYVINTVCGIIISVPFFKAGKPYHGVMYIFVWVTSFCLGLIITSFIYDHYKIIKKHCSR